jgi:hypothetical protein
MEREVIHRIVAGRNIELERQATRSAEVIINEIARQQGAISAAQTRITELRKELHELEVEHIDAKAILGGE